MVARVTHSEMPSFKVKIKSFLWLLVTIKPSQALVLKKSGVLHRMTLLGHVHFPQFRE